MSLKAINNVIGAAEVAGTGEQIQVNDPATGQPIATIYSATTDQLDAAVAQAERGAKIWSQTSLSKRTAVLYRMRELVHHATDEIAAAIAREHGKTHEDAAGEVARGLENIEFACGLANHLQGDYADQVSTAVDVYSYREPLGIVAGITPFNFPAMVPLWMAPIAIACGNAFILKPSERDPSASLILARLWREAGLPDGVFQVLHGSAALVNALCTHPKIAAISFVGSTAIAKHVYELASANDKRVQALGGAKNHAVVMPDANVEAAASHLVAAGYGSAGQRCMAISAVISVGDAERSNELAEAIKTKAAQLVVGPSDNPATAMGPVITEAAKQRVRTVVADARAAGARIVLDGTELSVAGYEGGNFVGPTLLELENLDCSAYREEVFGPVLVIVRAASLAEAIELINSGPYGNGSAIFTASGSAARQFQREVQTGMVGINVPIPVPVGSFSFGGRKASLFGDTHVYGKEGIQFYTRAKVVTSRWPEFDDGAASLAFPSERTA